MSARRLGIDPDLMLSERVLSSLGTARASIRVSLRVPTVLQLRALRPNERVRTIESAVDKGIERAIGAYELRKVSRKGHGFTAETQARDVGRLAREAYVASVFVEAVVARWKRSAPPRQNPWYAVTGLIRVEVEGRPNVNSSVEERIVLIRASTEEEATKKFAAYCERDNRPYLNDRGEIVSWKLAEVLGAYHTGVKRMDPNGTEISSQWRAESD